MSPQAIVTLVMLGITLFMVFDGLTAVDRDIKRRHPKTALRTEQLRKDLPLMGAYLFLLNIINLWGF